MEKKRIREAIIVEGRDDVDAVGKAFDALIIPTHGFGITAETRRLIDKAYEEIGIIILTDPDHSGEEIRRKLAARYPCAKHAYIAREEASAGGDIGVENATPGAIAEAVVRARVMRGVGAGDGGTAGTAGCGGCSVGVVGSAADGCGGCSIGAAGGGESGRAASLNNAEQRAPEQNSNFNYDRAPELTDPPAPNFIDTRVPESTDPPAPITITDLKELGLAFAPDAAKRRADASAKLGIGYSNAKLFIKKANAFGITTDQLRRALDDTE